MSLQEAVLYSLSDWKVEMDADVESDLLESAKEYSWKTPPSLTTCRVVNRSNTSATLHNLEQSLQTWKAQRRINSMTVAVHDVLDDVICIKCESDQGNLYNKRELEHQKVVLTDRLAAEALLRGSNLFNAGVLLSNAKQNEPVAVYWAVDKLLRGSKRYGGRAVLIASGMAACSSSDMIAHKTGLAVTVTNTAGPPLPPMSNYTSNFVLQNLPSCVVAHALKDVSGVILDMCSAPGGKAAHLASYGATIVSCDQSRRRMQAALKLYNKLCLDNIVPVALDTTKCVVSGAHTKSIKELLDQVEYNKDGLARLSGFCPGSFDGIILDPPCSALGLRPKLAVTTNGRKELDYIVRYQRTFVESAVQLLKPGGYLVYSTCTIRWQENEGMVTHLLKTYPEMKLLGVGVDCGKAGFPDKGLNEEQQKLVRRFAPCDEHIGFFVAKFQKRP